MMNMLQVDKGKTKCFTTEQQDEVDNVLNILLRQIVVTLNSEASRIMLMDHRPHESCSEEKPDVYFPYVNQGMLEDLIAELQARV